MPGSWCPAYSVASSLAGATEEDKRVAGVREREVKGRDEEGRGQGSKKSDGDGDGDGGEKREVDVGEMDGVKEKEKEKKTGMEPVHGVDRPFFHIDLVDAVDTAVRDAMKKDELAVSDCRENGAAS